MKKITATEIALMHEAQYHSKMNYEMAKALVKGRVDSRVLQYAEMIYKTQKDIFENKTL